MPDAVTSRAPQSLVLPILFFLILQGFIVTVLLESAQTVPWLVWYCNHVSLLYALAFWARERNIIKGIMSVGLVVQVAWIIDFFAHLLGFNLFNLTNYMFEGAMSATKAVALLAHMAVPAVIFVWTYKIPQRLISLFYSGIYIAVLWVVTLSFTSPDQNVNCVFSPCSDLMSSWNYVYLWPMYLAILAVATHILLYAIARFYNPTSTVSHETVSFYK